ncbi:MAG: PKD domain-containing protein [Methanospirillum sp.]|nr:PKD domain-containing protein [Methanospirillum sp.]MBP9009452.1 PKD domain-containing protein [Methanospirillum sp.]
MKYKTVRDTPYLILLILGIFLFCPCIAAGSEIISPVVFESGYHNMTEDRSGVSANETIQADSLTPPVALFSLSQSTGPVPLTVQFTDHSTGNPTLWGWYFGDGGTSNEQNPEHTYTAPGVYPVGFLVSNSAGYNKTFVPGLIQAQNPLPTPAPVPTPGTYPPAASFIGSPTTGPVPLTVLFIDTSADKPTSWAWYFGDGSYSPRQHPYHTYTRPGIYPVSLTASNAEGSDTFIAESYIVASTPVPTPTPRPTIRPPCPLVLSQSAAVTDPALPVAKFSAEMVEESGLFIVTFIDESLGDPTFRLWYFEDGSYSTDMNPVYTYTSPGTYLVSLMVVNDAGSSTISGKVEVGNKIGTGGTGNLTRTPFSKTTPLSPGFAEIVAQDPKSWAWFFEGWNTSEGSVPHLNLTPGGVSESEDFGKHAEESMALKEGIIKAGLGGL